MPAVRFKGDGSEYLNGVPAGDMDEDEFAALTAEQQAAIAASPLYSLHGADVEKAAESASRHVAREARANVETNKA